MPRKKLTEYFPKSDPPRFIGAYIPKSMRDAAKPILKAHHLSYSDIVRAAFKMFLDEEVSSKAIIKVATAENKYK